MKFLLALPVACLMASAATAQNDIDAMRYSQTGVGGSARFIAMGGAFGALGADVSCLSYNPAGLAIYQKGEVNFSAGLRFIGNDATHNGYNTHDFKTTLMFSGFGMAKAGKVKREGDRQAFGVALNQIANFKNSFTVQGPGNHKSIMDDMLAKAQGHSIGDLDPSYEGMGFNTLVLDTMGGHYYSFVNPQQSVTQRQDVQTSGRINELAFGYSYSIQDKFYLGISLGIPLVSFNYASNYSETDDKDSMRITNYPYSVYYYQGVGGFKSLQYAESYKTTGTGINLKIGGIYRINEAWRVGLAFQTPTVYNLTDTYLYTMSTTFDEGQGFNDQYPQNGGIFNYKIKTPMRLTASAAYIYKKLGAISVDYEMVNYSKATLRSSPNVFNDVNTVIRSKYSPASNLRIGAELNLLPLFVRAGYTMYGSPFGDSFSGKFVQNSFSGGIGFRSGNFCIDFTMVKSISKQNYYMYNAEYVDRTDLKLSGTNFVFTVGCKF